MKQRIFSSIEKSGWVKKKNQFQTQQINTLNEAIKSIILNAINATQFEQNNSVQCSEYKLIPHNSIVANLATEFQSSFNVCLLTFSWPGAQQVTCK